MTSLHLTAIVRKEDDMFTSWCPEIDIASQGETQEKAIYNLKEALNLHLKTTKTESKIFESFEELINSRPEFHCIELHRPTEPVKEVPETPQ